MKTLSVKKLSTVAFFFLSTGFLFSCRKDAPIAQTLPSSGAQTSVKNSSEVMRGRTGGIVPGPQPYTPPTFTMNWTGRANGTYSLTQATQDFGTTVSYWNAYNTQISGGLLKETLQKGVVGPTGGAMSLIGVNNLASYQIQFDMMFDPSFDFSWGGKVGFGLFIGDGTTGGVPGWDGNGGSIRLMWYKNTSTSPIILKPYAYYKDQPGTYGDDFGKAYPSDGTSIKTGVWYTVKIAARSNTGSNTDGHVSVIINGTTVLDQAIRWSTNDAQRLIKNICFENFRGGSETYWASPTDGSIYFNNVSWSGQ